MKVFVSGSTGFIGSHLALALANKGYEVHALYRSESKADVLRHPGIRLFKGDILDPDSLQSAMKGCVQVYHTAAFTKAWDNDASLVFRLNIEGAINVIEAGIKENVKRFVCTTTAGVLGPSYDDKMVNEDSPAPEKYFTSYEYSKAMLEKILRVMSVNGPEIIMVNPTRVYGPGILSESNSVTRIIDRYMRGKWRIIPGNGSSIGNYVFIDDVVRGHILAMDKGRNGERYVLGGANINYNDFFSTLSDLTGKRQSMIHVPVPLIMLISRFLTIFSYLSGIPPVITPSLAKKYSCNWKISSNKAQYDLGYGSTAIEEGLAKTIEWLKNADSTAGTGEVSTENEQFKAIRHE